MVHQLPPALRIANEQLQGRFDTNLANFMDLVRYVRKQNFFCTTDATPRQPPSPNCHFDIFGKSRFLAQPYGFAAHRAVTFWAEKRPNCQSDGAFPQILRFCAPATVAAFLPDWEKFVRR